MQHINLVFSMDGELVACVADDPRRFVTEEEFVNDCVSGAGMELHMFGDNFEKVRASVSDQLASCLVEKYDQDLTKQRYEIAWKLAEKYLPGYGCRATGQKSITPNGRVILAAECVPIDDENRDGSFECQFSVKSTKVLSCSIVTNGRVDAQVYPHEREYRID